MMLSMIVSDSSTLVHDEHGVVAVVGIPDERMGEVGCAFVVPRPGSDLSAEGVVAFARERLANYKVPREVRFVEVLPRNAGGKVLKNDLRDELRNA